jgi:hypothetical protein
MEGEHSPVLEEAIGEAEVPRPEAMSTCSSFGGDACDRSRDGSDG